MFVAALELLSPALDKMVPLPPFLILSVNDVFLSDSSLVSHKVTSFISRTCATDCVALLFPSSASTILAAIISALANSSVSTSIAIIFSSKVPFDSRDT